MYTFYGRRTELAELNSRFLGTRSEFFIIYGRRRVGKSELINEFIRQNTGLRIQVREGSRKYQLEQFAEAFSEFFHDPFISKNGFTNWDSVFEYLASRSTKRFILAIDEFPYLIKEDRSLLSIIQYYWDNMLKDTQIFLILSGSSIGMMEDEVLSYRSPLFGRRTGQLLLRSFRFHEIIPVFSTIRKAVEYYSVYGGTPAYILSVDTGDTIRHSIEKNLLNPASYLFREVEFLLRMELVEPRYYFAILLSISRGNNTQHLITHDTGIQKGTVNRYLATLIDLDIIWKEVPAFEDESSRKGRYFFRDNLFAFWFRFIFPNLERAESGFADKVFAESIHPHLSQYTGFLFERMVIDLLLYLNNMGRLPFPCTFSSMRRWWHKGEEIDVIGISDTGSIILFCEVKWHDNVDGKQVICDLKQKATFINWKVNERRELFLVIARSFSALSKEENEVCMDLAMIETLLSDRTLSIYQKSDNNAKNQYHK